MARVHSSLGDRTVYTTAGLAKGQGLPAKVYEDPQGTVLANLAVYDPTDADTPGAAIPGAALTVDAFSNRPAFWDLNDRDALYITVSGGPLEPIRPDAQPQVTALATRVGTVEGTAAAAETPAGAQAKADGAQAAAIFQVDARVVSLAVASGGDDTAAINAVLAASVGKLVRGRPGAAYRISAPLVVYSGTTLDMTSCTVTLIANSNCNLLNNAAVAATSTRDRDITVIGGTWVRPAPNGANNGWEHHSLRFRRVDGLLLDGVTVQTSVGKYAISLGDVTRYAVVGPTFAASSDGVHIQGPAQYGYIGRVRGSTGDDMVAVTPRDWSLFDDVSGAVSDLTIEDVSGVSTAACLVKILGGSPATSAQRITVRGVTGTANNNGIWVGDDTAQANTTGGLLDEITVERVAIAVPNTQSPVNMTGSNMRRVRVRGVTHDNINGTRAVVRYAPVTPQTMEALIVQGIDVRGLGGQVVEVATGATISRLTVDGVTVGSSVSGASVVSVVGTVTDLTLSQVSATLTGSTNVVALPNTATTARVDRLTISDVHVIGTGGALVYAPLSTQTLPRVEVSGVTMTGVGWLADLGATVELHLSGITTVSPAGGILNVRATAALIVKGAGLALAAGPQGLAVAAGGSVTSRSWDFEVDAAKLAKTANAMAFNTNGALGCGVGPIVCNGTAWKHLYTGLTYP